MPTSRESQDDPCRPPPAFDATDPTDLTLPTEETIHQTRPTDHIHQTDCGTGAPARSEPPASRADRGDVDAPPWTRALPPGAWVLRAAFRARPGLPAVRNEAAGR